MQPDRIIPTLRDSSLSPAQYARTTCFEGGYLTTKNAGWRNIRPVLDASTCTNCLQCYLLCPDGCIYKSDATDAPLGIDLDFCKGCGICAKACKFGSITMIPEQEA